MNDRLAEYRAFIASRAVATDRHGFDPQPFNGIGSTGYQAVKMGRRYLGFELKPEYAEQAGKNLSDAERIAGDIFGAAT